MMQGNHKNEMKDYYLGEETAEVKIVKRKT